MVDVLPGRIWHAEKYAQIDWEKYAQID